ALEVAAVLGDGVDVVPAPADLSDQRVGEPAGAVHSGADAVGELLPSRRVSAGGRVRDDRRRRRALRVVTAPTGERGAGPLLEGELELFLVADVGDRLELLVRVVVLRPQPDRVDVVRRAGADPEERQGGRAADPVDRAADGERLRPLLLGVSRTADVVDAGD